MVPIFTCLVYVLTAVIVAFLLIVITASVYLYFMHRKYDHLPGPKRASFFYGHIPLIKKTREEGSEFVILMQKWSLEYDGLYVIWFFGKPLLVVYHKDMIKDVMIKYNLRKPESIKDQLTDLFGTRFMKNGLVTMTDHKEWKKKRSAANPAFYRSHLKSLVPDYNKCCDKLLNKIAGMADGKTPVRMLDYFHRVTLDVIGKVAFDIEFNSVEGEHTAFPLAVANCMKGMMLKFRNPFYKIDFSTFKFQREVADGLKLLRETGRQSIELRQAALGRGETIPNDILSTMMKLTDLHGIGTQEDLLDDFVTFFIAGQETTANQLSFLLLEVVQRPDVLEKLMDEIEDVLGPRDYVDFDDLSKLEYMGQVLKETLRLYPPAPSISRMSTEPIVLNGYEIPPNTRLHVNIFSTHRYPGHFEDPERFDPDRWSPANADKIPHFAFLPFSAGPRICIGQVFAQFESKVLLARLLKKFQFTLCPGQTRTIKQQATLQPRDGVTCTLVTR